MLAAATTASAGQPESALKLAAIFSGAAAADLASTEYALARGAVEANPLGQRRAARIGMGIALVAGETWSVRALQRHDHPTAARWVKWGIVAGKCLVALHNVHAARQR